MRGVCTHTHESRYETFGDTASRLHTMATPPVTTPAATPVTTPSPSLPTLSFSSRRSPVICAHGAIATSQPLASEIGYRVLRAGGNAADACVAAVAALNVTEPCMTGIGAHRHTHV